MRRLHPRLAAGIGLGTGLLSGAAVAVLLTAATTAGAATIPTAGLTPANLFSAPQQAVARTMWRAPRVKGACMSCHGPDHFDLARIGSSDADLRRRAVVDGASAREADDLVVAVRQMRLVLKLPATNPRRFRPLQPGGAVQPGATSAERDLALGKQLQALLPTLGGARPITSLAAAEKARDELLALDFARVKLGVAFPLWSADRFHGATEAVMNDWVADIAREPTPERRAEWLALQDRYLADPSDANLWSLYFALGSHTAAFTSPAPFDLADGSKAVRLAELKFRSTLLGQHVLRAAALGRGNILAGQMPLAYLAGEPFRTRYQRQPATGGHNALLPDYLPNPWWEFGDFARSGFDPSDQSRGQPGNIGGNDLMVDRLRLLGWPQFVIDSVDPTLRAASHESDLKLAWFLIGLRLDPGLARTSQSNSTLVGEYLQGELHTRDMFIHRLLVEAMRKTISVYRPEARGPLARPYRLDFGYFDAYNRHTPLRWNQAENQALPSATRDAQIAQYIRLTANFLRMSLYLHEQALDQGLIAPYGNAAGNNDGAYAEVAAFFRYAGGTRVTDDLALARRVAAKAGTTVNF